MASPKPLTDEEMFGAQPAQAKPLTDDEMFGSSLSQGTANQSSGPIISPVGLINKLKPTKEQIPELIGVTLGGLTGGFPGAMLGGAAGESYKQLGQRVGLLKGEPPQTSEDAAKGMLGGAVRGGVAELGGKVVGKVFEPFSGSVSPEIKVGLEAAKRAEIKPPLSAITESKPVQALERFAEFGPFGSPITAQKQNAIKQLENFSEKISKDLGPEDSVERVADKVYNKTKDFELAFKKAKDEVYDPINKTLGNLPVNAENTMNAIKNVLDQKAGGKEGQALLKDWMERLSPGYDVPGMVTARDLPEFNTLKAIRTEIGSRGNFNDPGVTGIKSQLEGIYAAASKDMDAFAERHGMGDALKKANDLYSTGIRELQGSLINTLQNNAKDPAKLANLYTAVFKNDNPPLIKTARNILGDDGFAQLRKQWFDNLIEKSKTVIDGEEIISPSKLSNNLRKVGSSLQEIASDNPQLAQKLSDLSETSKLLTRGLKVTSGSQTGFILSALKDIRGMLAAPLVRTETGREFLTTGFPTLGKIAGRTAQIGGQVGLQKATE